MLLPVRSIGGVLLSIKRHRLAAAGLLGRRALLRCGGQKRRLSAHQYGQPGQKCGNAFAYRGHTDPPYLRQPSMERKFSSR